jgi:hypothetical protein
MIGRISREDARRPAFNLEWNRCLPVSGLLGATLDSVKQVPPN